MSNCPTAPNRRSAVILGLISVHAAAVCLSFVYASSYHPELVAGNLQQVSTSLLLILAAGFVLLTPLFGAAGFSFGYLIGFYLFQMLLGFLFLNAFTARDYNHYLAGFSALISAGVFLVPALFVRWRPKSLLSPSATVIDRTCLLILALGVAVAITGATYNFRADLGFSADFHTELLTAHLRNELSFPGFLRYPIGIFSSTLIPFAFAYFVLRQQHWKALASLALLAVFFPITLSKTHLFTPAWLLFVALLSRAFEARIAAILSLTIPLLIGLLAAAVVQHDNDVFRILAFRMIDIPSAALAVYNEFFSHHEVTHFCQLSVAKLLTGCSYEQLGLVMARAYGLGNYNASLFASEGIASVGVILAPVAALLSGLIVAIGNCVSERLPPQFVLISSCVLSQAILNVPLSTALLTHGGALLFLLWYIIPADAFPKSAPSTPKVGPLQS